MSSTIVKDQLVRIEVLAGVYMPELGRRFGPGEMPLLPERIAKLMVRSGYAVYLKAGSDPVNKER